MSRKDSSALPSGITRKTRTVNGEKVEMTSADGTPIFRVRAWDAVLKKQVERNVVGLREAKAVLAEFSTAKSRPGPIQAEKIRFADVAARYVVAYKTKRDGTPRPKSSVAKERNVLNAYLLPTLGRAWIGDLDLPDLNNCIRRLKLQDGADASPSTKGTAAAVLRRLFIWAREDRLITMNPALELRTGWGAPARRRVVVPSIPQVTRLASALDHFKPGLGDVAVVMAFVGLRWEEIVAVPADQVDLDRQTMLINRTASESGGRRDVREDMKTASGVRTVTIPDVAVPAVRRLLKKGEAGRLASEGKHYSRLVNGDRGGFLGYATWRKFLALAQGFTAGHEDGMVKYTAHELRHVCASLLIASGASDLQVAYQMGHRRIETTKNIYGHLFIEDRSALLVAMNAAVGRLQVASDESATAAA
ncbi:site-specific integrase [Kineosporia sp. J2-2]|uniref:Site-specific integrase n=1 Tax=Kineosporia corallincola TaxID=2835133 RepID=A0ABS5TJI6_9ACTN|nr:site-specific integrase [Kineosporia corallincola]MBT0771257.1 site-specific integrase [Kineosporia corallincola]